MQHINSIRISTRSAQAPFFACGVTKVLPRQNCNVESQPELRSGEVVGQYFAKTLGEPFDALCYTTLQHEAIRDEGNVGCIKDPIATFILLGGYPSSLRGLKQGLAPGALVSRLVQFML